MGRVVGIAGGNGDSIKAFEKYAIQLSGKAHPNVVYIGTATKDGESGVQFATELFQSLGCSVKTLSLVTHTYTDTEIDEILSWADLIYVGGGNTVFMMKVWKEFHLDEKLRAIYEKDLAVLSGISAGAICWFNCGHSDSESFEKADGWRFIWAEGMLDFYHMVYCPHYNEPGRDSFDEMLKEKDLIGLALENDTAFVEENGKQYFIRSSETAKAYRLEYVNGVLDKREVEFRVTV